MFWIAFSLTILIEGALVFLVFRTRRALVAMVLINCVVHPLSYGLFTTELLVPASLSSLLWFELVIALIEAAVLALFLKNMWQRAFIAGYLVNVVSFAVGLMVL